MATPVNLERVTQAMRIGVQDVLAQAAEYRTRAELIEAICGAVVTAEDKKSRRCVVTRNPSGELFAFGPYATTKSAMEALESGLLASVEGTRATVLPLIPAPKASA